MNTTIYLIRHSIIFKEYQNIDSKETLIMKNINMPLSIEGEKLAREYFKKEEFQNIDVVYSSNYVRAIATAKHIASYNNLKVNISNNFNERLHGVNNWNELPTDFEIKQFNNEDYKINNGESKKEVRTRMLEGIEQLLSEYKGKRIAIIGHATSISYLLDTWCKTTYLDNYYFNNQVFFDGKFNYLETFKLVFDEDNQLINISNIRP